jgi:hypothetical protein
MVLCSGASHASAKVANYRMALQKMDSITLGSLSETAVYLLLRTVTDRAAVVIEGVYP